MFKHVTPQNVSELGCAPFLSKSRKSDWRDTLMMNNLDIYVDFTFDHYSDVIIHMPEVWQWFKDRKILLTHELIERFKIGFADRSLCKKYHRDKGRQAEILRGALQMLEILRSTGHQAMYGDVVLPFFDIDGRIVGAYGRRISPENRSAQIYHHHWFNGKATFFNLKALKEFNQVVLCKSPIEALVLLSAGFSNVTATMGMYSFGQYHLELLEELKPKEIVLAYDATDAGNLVTGMIAQALEAQGVACRRLTLNKNMDVVSFAQHYEDYISKFSALLESAVPYQQTFENIVRD